MIIWRTAYTVPGTAFFERLGLKHRWLDETRLHDSSEWKPYEIRPSCKLELALAGEWYEGV
jgi:hypothetical protein